MIFLFKLSHRGGTHKSKSHDQKKYFFHTNRILKVNNKKQE
jgi:hypothetical protein